MHQNIQVSVIHYNYWISAYFLSQTRDSAAFQSKKFSLILFRPVSVLGYYSNSADLVQTLQNATSDQGLHCLLREITIVIKMLNYPPETSKSGNGFIQVIRMDKSTGQKRGNLEVDTPP